MVRYAVIDIGSYEVKCKIYEISSKNQVVLVDTVRHVMELGRDLYNYGVIRDDSIEEICRILESFRAVLKTYRVTSYKVCSTSVFREAGNERIAMERIRVKTGFQIDVLENAQQCFYEYKALMLKDAELKKALDEGAAIVEVGPGSIQISLFQNGLLLATQNMKLGSLRMREILYRISTEQNHLEQLMQEIIDNDLLTFKRMYLQQQDIKHVIALGDYIVYLAKKDAYENVHEKEKMERKTLLEKLRRFRGRTPVEISTRLNIASEHASLLIPCAMVYERILEVIKAKHIWLTNIDLCDGLAVEYAQEHKKIANEYDFTDNIYHQAYNIAARYNSNMQHIQCLEDTVIKIYDAMKNYHGLGIREKMLLRLSAILHSCGKYISTSNSAECSYTIICETEIIGLTQQEKEMIAHIVLYSHKEVADWQETNLDGNVYDIMIKLSAILRIGHAVDRSHKHKFKDFVVQLKDNELIIMAKTNEDITLERGLFPKKAEYFREVYGIMPVLKKKSGGSIWQ